MPSAATLDPILFPWALQKETAGQSLHVCVDVNFSSSEIHGPNPPDLPRVDPGVILGRRGETYVLTKVGDRLSSARHAHAVGRQRDPVTVLSFNDRANIKVDAAVGAYPE